MSYRIRKTAVKFLFFSLATAGLLALASGCSAKKIGNEPVNKEEVTVTIPGMKGEVRLLFLADLHINTLNDQVSEGEKETVRGRIDWSSRNGVTADKLWDEWVDYINSAKADYVLFGGDMLDCCAEKNTEILKAGLEKLNKPYMYVRADHDIKPYYLSGVSPEDCRSYQDAVCDNSDIMIKDFGDFLVVGWNNSTEHPSTAGLENFKAACNMGKPIILLTHVPIESLVDGSLAQASREAYGGRSIIWGFGESDYDLNDNLKEMLKIIYSEDSPIIEILCGHLHLTWDGFVTSGVHEHVFSHAFAGFYGIVTVNGK